MGGAFGFLVGGRIWEYCDEEGGKGRGRVARRFEREMRAYRYVRVLLWGGGDVTFLVVSASDST